MAKPFNFSTIEEKTSSKSLRYTKFHKITGRVDIVWRIFKKTAKKLKLKSQDPKKYFFFNVFISIKQKISFSVPVTSLLNFWNFLQKAPVYIDPSGHFVFYEILCSSNFLGRTSPGCYSWGSQVVGSKFLYTKLVHKLFINDKDIQPFWTLKKKPLHILS